MQYFSSSIIFAYITQFLIIKKSFKVNPEIVLFLEPYYSEDFEIKVYDIYKSLGYPLLKFLIIKDTIEEKFLNRIKIFNFKSC